MTNAQFEKIKKVASTNKMVLSVYIDGEITPITEIKDFPLLDDVSLGQVISRLKEEINSLKSDLENEINERKAVENKLLEIISKLNK